MSSFSKRAGNMFRVKPKIETIDPYRLSFNVGCLIDIPTGKYVRGMKGENLLNGGICILTGVVGRGNTFKSTFSHYLMLAAASRIADCGVTPYMQTYDTEMNISLDRLVAFSRNFPSFKERDIIHEGDWEVTDKILHSGNEWWEKMKDFVREEKVKNKKNYEFETPFIDKDGKPVKAVFPSFTEIDSLSEFETDDIQEIQDKHEIGASGGNTIFMRGGLVKTRLLTELPAIANSGSNYIILTSHVGDSINIQQGPINAPPPKKLQHMRGGDKIKGAADKLYFLTTHLWQTASTTLLNNQGTKGPEYPRVRTDVEAGGTDLNLVTVKNLRNKTGISGFTLPIIISQREGVLDTLTEFHFIKENGRFGLEGSLQHYNVVLFPEVKLGRTTVRSCIDENPLLRKAIKFTSDILQIQQNYKDLPFEIPTMEELYAKLESEYGWDTLLRTRDYPTFDHYENPVPYLSAMDLLEMFHGLYFPYWWVGKKEVKEKKEVKNNE